MKGATRQGTREGPKFQVARFTADPKHSTLNHVSHSLNSKKGAYVGDSIRDYYAIIKGDTRSLSRVSPKGPRTQMIGFKGPNTTDTVVFGP